MGRKKVKEPQLKSWEEVDECLRHLSDAEDEIEKIQSDMNMEIAQIKKNADDKAKELKESIKNNERKIKEYTTIHQTEMAGKSKVLTFGTVGFRKSSRLILPQAINEVIAKLRQRGMCDCIIVKETVDKDAVKKYSEEDILAVGGLKCYTKVVTGVANKI